jgi:hypothetical protein
VLERRGQGQLAQLARLHFASASAVLALRFVYAGAGEYCKLVHASLLVLELEQETEEGGHLLSLGLYILPNYLGTLWILLGSCLLRRNYGEFMQVSRAYRG